MTPRIIWKQIFVNRRAVHEVNCSATWELAFALIHFLCVLVFLKKALWEGSTTFSHDNLLWNFPIFHFFAETLLQGEIPLWNPYSNGGEPFYPLWGQMRLFEPLTFLTIGMGKFFTTNLVLLFNWHRIVLSLWMGLGIYLLFRSLLPSLLHRFILIVILFYSSVMLGSFRADGYLNNFLWIPWMLYFWNRNWFLFAIALGINFQNYFFVAPLITFALCLLTRPERPPKVVWLILFCFAAPNVALFWERDRFLFPTRPNGIAMDLGVIRSTGSSLSPWNFLQLVAPEGNPSLLASDPFHSWAFHSWGAPSEAFVYLGLIPLAFAFMGLAKFQTKRDLFWGVSLFTFSVLGLGPTTPLYRILFPFFPPLWLTRQTQFFAPMIGLCLLYFFCRGVTEKKVNRVATFAYAVLLLTALYHSPDRKLHFLLFTCFLILPFLFARKNAILLLAVTLDLGFHFTLFHRLYDAQASPHQALKVSANAEGFGYRGVIPDLSSPNAMAYRNIRYLEWITREPLHQPTRTGYLQLKSPHTPFRWCREATISNSKKTSQSTQYSIFSPVPCELSQVSSDPYWKMEIDGEKQKPLKGFILPPGHHEIRLVYWPYPFLMASLLFYLPLTLITLNLGFFGASIFHHESRVSSQPRRRRSREFLSIRPGACADLPSKS